MSSYCRLAMVIAAGASLVIMQAACGPEPGPGASPASASPRADTTPAASPPPQPTASAQPVPAKAVTVSLGADKYRSGDLVQVTIANGLDRQIYTEDFHTDCTVVTLQSSGSGGWTDIEGCKMGRPTRTIGIPAGTTYAQTLDPNSFHVKFGPGTYRISFSYHFQPNPMGDNPSTVYSAAFTVS